MKNNHHHDHHLSSSMTSTTSPTASAPTAQPEITREAIARRAYELFFKRGAEGGNADEDWLAAERDLRADAHRS
jgi:hypothetical protein